MGNPLSNPKWEQFAKGIGLNGLSATESYVKAGYSKSGAAVSAHKLLKNAKVKARVKELAEHVAEHVAEKIIAVSIASRNDRLAAADRRWKLMEQLMAARAAEMAEIAKTDPKKIAAGASTGLLVKRIKAVGSGANFKLGYEYEFDAALFREMRELEKQAAQDVGDWTEKRQVTGKDGGPLSVELFDSWLEEADAAAEAMKE